MRGLDPRIHVFTLREKNEKRKTWMPGTKAGHDEIVFSVIDSVAGPGWMA
jgi:hypothetical protein